MRANARLPAQQEAATPLSHALYRFTSRARFDPAAGRVPIDFVTRPALRHAPTPEGLQRRLNCAPGVAETKAAAIDQRQGLEEGVRVQELHQATA